MDCAFANECVWRRPYRPFAQAACHFSDSVSATASKPSTSLCHLSVKAVFDHMSRVTRRPVEFSRNVHNPAADGVVACRLDCAVMHVGVYQCASSLAQKREPMTTPSAPSISAAASPRPSAMPPAAQSNVSTPLCAIWSAISGTRVMVPAILAVPASFRALRHNNVCANLNRALGVLERLHLTDQRKPILFNLRRIRRWIGEG